MFKIILYALASVLKSHRQPTPENVALRHQLEVYDVQAPHPPATRHHIQNEVHRPASVRRRDDLDLQNLDLIAEDGVLKDQRLTGSET